MNIIVSLQGLFILLIIFIIRAQERKFFKNITSQTVSLAETTVRKLSTLSTSVRNGGNHFTTPNSNNLANEFENTRF